MGLPGVRGRSRWRLASEAEPKRRIQTSRKEGRGRLRPCCVPCRISWENPSIIRRETEPTSHLRHEYRSNLRLTTSGTKRKKKKKEKSGARNDHLPLCRPVGWSRNVPARRSRVRNSASTCPSAAPRGPPSCFRPHAAPTLPGHRPPPDSAASLPM